MSGKKKLFFNGEMIHETQKVSKEWNFSWPSGLHLVRVEINFEEYNLIIDGIPFRRLDQRPPLIPEIVTAGSVL
ncbi:unnamed protein product [Choristocarpus tenellus]